jgi:hypothetical protein
MHPTLGILARFQAFFYASAFFQLGGFAQDSMKSLFKVCQGIL